MKKILRLVFIFSIFALMLFSSSVYAEKIVYRAGIVDDYSFNGNDIFQYATESAKSVFQYVHNSDLSFSDMTSQEGIAALDNGSIDFVCMVPKDDAFSSRFEYTDEPVGVGFLNLFTNSESNIYYEDFTKFNGTKIAILANSFYEDELKAYSTAHGFQYTPVYFNTIDEMVNAVNSQTVDAMLSPATQRPDGMRIIGKCGTISYYCAVKTGNTEMLSTLNTAIATLKDASPFYISDNYTNTLRIPYRNMAALTEDEYSTLKSQQKLRILVPKNNYPLSFYNSGTDSYDGVLEDIVRKIADTVGFEAEFIPYDHYDATMNNIVMGEGDALLAASGTSQGLITATTPYTSISYIPVSRNNASFFEDNEIDVGVLSDDLWISTYINETHPQWNLVEYNSINSLLSAVEGEKVSIALISSPDMQTKTSLIAHPDLSIMTDFTVSIPVSLGISDVTCDDEMVDLLNKTINNMSVPEAELENKIYTLSHIYVPNFRDMIYANRQFVILILIIIAVLFVIVKLRENHFRKLSRTDSITQIPNKLYFDKAAHKLMSKNPDRPYLVASIDAKNFKLVNESFGRIIGDQALRDIANEIARIFKGNGIYARFQSDNFVVLTEDTEDGRKRLDELEDMDIHIHNSSRYQVPIKIGVFPVSHYDSPENLSQYIDKANIAKSYANGVNTNYLSYFTDEMNEQLNTQNSIEIEMTQALNRGDFVVYYQPKYELSSDNIIGAEALVRWKHKEKGIISPGLFIPLFEKNGFIVKLDFYVYEEVLKMLRSRIMNHEPVVPISMNVSRCHLGDNDFVRNLEELVDKYQVPKEYIEMEITESIFSQEDTSAISLLYELKRHGFTISMDDFGSGYSSLNLLRKLPIDTLKIDKVFIDNSENSHRSEVIVEEIISMASKIHVKTICEGVETQKQRDFLKNAGCDMVQGFFYSKPLPCSDFETLLNSSN
jgi:diguanylate cyclase (GGDEF)-like protein